MRGLPAVALHHQHPMKTTVSLPAEGSGMRALYALASRRAARRLRQSVAPSLIAAFAYRQGRRRYVIQPICNRGKQALFCN